MRTLDGIRCISSKEYAEMMEITVGRVSQMKSELPFIKIEEWGMELINFDLLEIQQKEKIMAHSKFETTTPIHLLSYKDLGSFFAKFAMDLVQFKGNADMKLEELQSKNNEQVLLYKNLQSELAKVVDSERECIAKLNAAENTLENERKDMATMVENHDVLLEKFNLLDSEQEAIKKAHEELQIIQNQSKHELEIKVIENSNLVAQNEALKKRIEAMEATMENQANFQQEFQNFKDLVMDKFKQ